MIRTKGNNSKGLFRQDDLEISGTFDNTGINVVIKNNSFRTQVHDQTYVAIIGSRMLLNAKGRAEYYECDWDGCWHPEEVAACSTGWPLDLPPIGQTKTYNVPYDGKGVGANTVEYYASRGWIDTPLSVLNGFIGLQIMWPSGLNPYYYSERQFTLTPAAVAPVLATLSGTVTDQNGAPVKDVSVLLQNLEAFTNSEGRYSFTGIPVGSYPLKFSKYLYGEMNMTIQITAGTTTKNLTMTKTIVTGALNGKVTDATSGAGIPNVLVSLSGAGGSGETLTDLNGNYNISGIPVGTYALTYTKDGYTTVTL